MDYEMVQLEEKSVVGLKIRTSNHNPNLGREVGGLWQEFLEAGVYQSIPHKQNDRTIGL
ncbi:GyrI-like domain-containing protein [Sporolactobacillus pectinivorans]|uniref:GyrI-like domain-containing protein n=1 Tax=Sporolactobacillus pectinivorans TaxID=1591408 RepID=UPI0012FD02F4|nr:effector binding domain-containing protein [Sporolactobacillus pectinivorans]